MRHLIDSADWTLEEIEKLWELSRRLKSGTPVEGIDNCLRRKTVILAFSERSTRTRLTIHKAIVEMGGFPFFVDPDEIHKKTVEDLKDFSRALAVSSAAICMRLSSSKNVPPGSGEAVLRSIAAIADDYSVPVVSLRHDRCHPCQGLYEALTIQEALGRKDLRGARILYTWVKGDSAAPWSPTHDSIMLSTRLGAAVTLCNPAEYELDESIIATCRKNAEKSRGTFTVTADFESSFDGQEIVYARHWATEEQQASGGYEDWFLDEDRFQRAKPGAFFIHPMPLKRDIEVVARIADGSQSLIGTLVENKYFLQKAVLAQTTGFGD